MSDELQLNGKQYVSSKKAAEITGYARDYIGQLSRGGLIDAERVGGLWYVSLDSLNGYEKNAETARSITAVSQTSRESESALVFEGKDYISASRASKISGYNQDYVGQLARGQKIPSRQIGNRWYVDRDALLAHKAEKDALLAAVQSESVGLSTQAKPFESKMPVAQAIKPETTGYSTTYLQESSDLLPLIPVKAGMTDKTPTPLYPISNFSEIRPRTVDSVTIPVPSPVQMPTERRRPAIPLRKKPKKAFRRVVGALTIILMLSIGIAATKHTQLFASMGLNTSGADMSATAVSAAGRLGDILENVLSPELHYESEQ